MIFKNYTIDGDKITLTRQEIEEVRNSYMDVVRECIEADNTFLSMIYSGKADSLTEILKVFEYETV